MKRPNGLRRDGDRFRSNNRARSTRYYYAMQSMREHVLRARRRIYIYCDVIRRYTSTFLRKAPIIEEEGAEMALFNIREQLAIMSHGDCNHPLVIRRIASGPRLSIRNPPIFYPIKKTRGAFTVVQNAAHRLIRHFRYYYYYYYHRCRQPAARLKP